MLDVNSFAPGVFLSSYIKQIAEMDEVKKTETGVGRREVRINLGFFFYREGRRK
ncbi:MAG: hypothetical protein K6G87_05840 [Butyrivibrio sp.]|uniref:hypothetical protein n=1 Tax=Butyrivibrio sp. TaxID=28121 RepID=UPI0025EA6F45|nr:hypothetical protein [Butyrivibrio sp.]MCR5770744.1 hypothetical protein [Butyrivibrio sp.]